MSHKLNMVVTIIGCLYHPTKLTVYITLLKRFHFKNYVPSLCTIVFLRHQQQTFSSFHFIYYVFQLLYLNLKLPAFNEKIQRHHSNNLNLSLHGVIFSSNLIKLQIVNNTSHNISLYKVLKRTILAYNYQSIFLSSPSVTLQVHRHWDQM